MTEEELEQELSKTRVLSEYQKIGANVDIKKINTIFTSLIQQQESQKPRQEPQELINNIDKDTKGCIKCRLS